MRINLPKMKKKQSNLKPGAQRVEQNSKKLEGEPYILYENSVNKDTEFLGYAAKDVIFHSFLTKVLNQGLKTPFNFNHMFKLPKYLQYENIVRQMNSLMTPEYKEDILSGKKSIYSFYHQLVGFRLKLGVLLTFISEVVLVLLPPLLKRLISWIEGFEDEDSGERYEGIMITSLISLVITISKLSLFASRYYSIQAQVHAQAFAYVRKSLREN